MRPVRVISLALLSFALAWPAAIGQDWSAPIREIARPDLPDVAMASYDSNGPVIYYNPVILSQLPGALSAFFRAHEYGHIELNHVQREAFDANPYSRAWVRQQYEKEADCFATRALRDWSPQAVRTAMQFFAQYQGRSRPDWYHPTGYERAAQIQFCLGSAPAPGSCTAHIACQHRVACSHTMPCVHRMACQHPVWNGWRWVPAHPFDTQHQFDTAHPFDTVHPFDCAN